MDDESMNFAFFVYECSYFLCIQYSFFY